MADIKKLIDINALEDNNRKIKQYVKNQAKISDWNQNSENDKSYIKNRTHYEEIVPGEYSEIETATVETTDGSGVLVSLDLPALKALLREKYLPLIEGDNIYNDQMDDIFKVSFDGVEVENLQFAMYNASEERAGWGFSLGLGNPTKAGEDFEDFLSSYKSYEVTSRINTDCNFFLTAQVHSYEGYADMDDIRIYDGVDSGSHEHSFSISIQGTETVVHQLDPKFIQSTVNRVTALEESVGDIDTISESDIEDMFSEPLPTR